MRKSYKICPLYAADEPFFKIEEASPLEPPPPSISETIIYRGKKIFLVLNIKKGLKSVLPG